MQSSLLSNKFKKTTTRNHAINREKKETFFLSKLLGQRCRQYSFVGNFLKHYRQRGFLPFSLQICSFFCSRACFRFFLLFFKYWRCLSGNINDKKSFVKVKKSMCKTKMIFCIICIVQPFLIQCVQRRRKVVSIRINLIKRQDKTDSQTVIHTIVCGRCQAHQECKTKGVTEAFFRLAIRGVDLQRRFAVGNNTNE